MSDNKHAFAVLRQAEILAVKHLPLTVIPQVIKRGEASSRRCSSSVREKSSDVFKEKKAWSFGLRDPSDVKKERTARVVEATSFAVVGKGLARKSTTQYVEMRQSVGIDLGDVSPGLMCGEVLLVDLLRRLVDF